MNFDDTESEDDEPQPQEPVEQPAPAPESDLPSAARLLNDQETPDYVVTQTNVNGLETIEETVRTTNVPLARPIKETGEKEAAEERQMKVRHEALKKQGLARTKKRNRDQAAQNMAKPAYERQSMHGQKIAISVGPSSLPDTCRTTWSAIPSKSAWGR
jgi:hypothetical protein